MDKKWTNRQTATSLKKKKKKSELQSLQYTDSYKQRRKYRTRKR